VHSRNDRIGDLSRAAARSLSSHVRSRLIDSATIQLLSLIHTGSAFDRALLESPRDSRDRPANGISRSPTLGWHQEVSFHLLAASIDKSNCRDDTGARTHTYATWKRARAAKRFNRFRENGTSRGPRNGRSRHRRGQSSKGSPFSLFPSVRRLSGPPILHAKRRLA